MFEVGWSEILVIAVVALLVFPTEDLPKLLRTAGQLVGRLRRMAGEFQSQVNTVIREAEREVDGGTSLNPLADLKKTLDPIRSIGDDLKRSVTAATVASTVTTANATPAVPPPAEVVPAQAVEPPTEPIAVAADAPADPLPAEPRNDGTP